MAEETRGARLRIMGSCLLLVLASLATVRGCTGWFEERFIARDPWGTARVKSALAFLEPMLRETDGDVLFFGSSDVERNFEREALVAGLSGRGVATEVWNYGFAGINTEIQLLLARRMREGMETSRSRFRLAVIEFTPLYATRRRRGGTFAKRYEQFEALLATPRELEAMALRSPSRAARLASYKYLLRSVSPSAITVVAQFVLFGTAGGAADGGTKPELERLRAQVSRESARLLEREGHWSLANRGFPVSDDRLRETLLALSAREIPAAEFEADARWREDCCGLLSLELDPEYLAAFGAAVDELAAVSDQVVLLVTPLNRDFVKRSPAVDARVRSTVETWARRHGGIVLDLSSQPRFGSREFDDVTHLNLVGARRLSAIVSIELGSILRTTSRPRSLSSGPRG